MKRRGSKMSHENPFHHWLFCSIFLCVFVTFPGLIIFPCLLMLWRCTTYKRQFPLFWRKSTEIFHSQQSYLTIFFLSKIALQLPDFVVTYWLICLFIDSVQTFPLSEIRHLGRWRPIRDGWLSAVICMKIKYGK